MHFYVYMLFHQKKVQENKKSKRQESTFFLKVKNEKNRFRFTITLEYRHQSK